MKSSSPVTGSRCAAQMGHSPGNYITPQRHFAGHVNRQPSAGMTGYRAGHFFVQSVVFFGNEENPEYSPNASGDKVYYTQSGAATWMGALLLQVEFPKVTIPKRKNFRTFSLFTEGQLWFVPTDVDADAYGIPCI